MGKVVSLRHRVAQSITSEALVGYVMVSPALIILAVFVLIPAVAIFLLSLTDWNGISSTPNFEGLRNYSRLLQDPIFHTAVRNTFIYTILSLPLTLIAGFLAALLVETDTRQTRVLRVVFMSPFVISITVVAVIWMWLLEPNFGLLNYVLESLQLRKQSWIQNPGSAMIVIVFVSLWRQFGYYMLIFLAGLKTIDKSYYEAAQIDGAGYWRTRLFITFPLLGPQIFFALIIGAIDSFQVFALVDLMTRGGPLNTTTVVIYYMYQQGFQFFNLGVASAISVILVVWVVVLTFIQVRFLGRRIFYD